MPLATILNGTMNKLIHKDMRNLGIILVVVGILMMAITGFNYVTKEKVVDIGPLEINKERSHPVQWSPIIGGILLIGGIIALTAKRKVI
jgi:hypothetical protein